MHQMLAITLTLDGYKYGYKYGDEYGIEKQ